MTSRCRPVCRIVADTFERHSGIVETLPAAGIDVKIESLPAGDYDLGRGVLVERKTVGDLREAIS
jgi:ERCC4-type nuclease